MSLPFEPPPFEWQISFMITTEAEARELMAGRVPERVQEMARTLIDFQYQDARNAARPVKARQTA
jgi:hypothetical protein